MINFPASKFWKLLESLHSFFKSYLPFWMLQASCDRHKLWLVTWLLVRSRLYNFCDVFYRLRRNMSNSSATLCVRSAALLRMRGVPLNYFVSPRTSVHSNSAKKGWVPALQECHMSVMASEIKGNKAVCSAGCLGWLDALLQTCQPLLISLNHYSF